MLKKKKIRQRKISTFLLLKFCKTTSAIPNGTQTKLQPKAQLNQQLRPQLEQSIT